MTVFVAETPQSNFKFSPPLRKVTIWMIILVSEKKKKKKDHGLFERGARACFFLLSDASKRFLFSNVDLACMQKISIFIFPLHHIFWDWYDNVTLAYLQRNISRLYDYFRSITSDINQTISAGQTRIFSACSQHRL